MSNPVLASRNKVDGECIIKLALCVDFKHLVYMKYLRWLEMNYELNQYH